MASHSGSSNSIPRSTTSSGPAQNRRSSGKDVRNAGDQIVSGGVAILLIGSNGLTLDAQGRLIVTAMTDRTIFRLEKDGTRTVLADRYDKRTALQRLLSRQRRQSNPAWKRQGPSRRFPNGITLSPDEKSLNVTAGFGKTFRYEVLADDTAANGSLFIPAGNDGMKTDLRRRRWQEPLHNGPHPSVSYPAQTAGILPGPLKP